LLVHDAVRGPVTAALNSRDPARDIRRTGAQLRRSCVTNTGRHRDPTGWRCTADVLYLLENDNLREGFFPTTQSPASFEPARAGDGTSISAIIRKFDGPQSRQALERWWHYHPDSFFVVRDEQDGVQGFYQAIVASKVHKAVIGGDPLAASWARDVPRSEDRAATLWLRRSLDRDTGEGPSSGQAACWLDIKRTYLELLWNCVRGCAGSIPAPVMRSYIAAYSSNWDSGCWTNAARSSTGLWDIKPKKGLLKQAGVRCTQI
jgi:hypothetical protein